MGTKVVAGGQCSRAAVVVLVATLVAMASVEEAGAACGNVNTLISCLPAAKNPGVNPTPSCCQAMANFAQGGTPDGQTCLCQAITNPTATAAGAKPQLAVQIPQKCNLNYKAGYVCNGEHVMSSLAQLLIN